MLQLGYLYKDLYEMTLEELINTLEQRRKGIAYEIWKKGNLNQIMENYPETPEKACPELYPKLKGIPMPNWVIEKYIKGRGQL